MSTPFGASEMTSSDPRSSIYTADPDSIYSVSQAVMADAFDLDDGPAYDPSYDPDHEMYGYVPEWHDANGHPIAIPVALGRQRGKLAAELAATPAAGRPFFRTDDPSDESAEDWETDPVTSIYTDPREMRARYGIEDLRSAWSGGQLFDSEGNLRAIRIPGLRRVIPRYELAKTGSGVQYIKRAEQMRKSSTGRSFFDALCDTSWLSLMPGLNMFDTTGSVGFISDSTPWKESNNVYHAVQRASKGDAISVEDAIRILNYNQESQYRASGGVGATVADIAVRAPAFVAEFWGTGVVMGAVKKAFVRGMVRNGADHALATYGMNTLTNTMARELAGEAVLKTAADVARAGGTEAASAALAKGAEATAWSVSRATRQAVAGLSEKSLQDASAKVATSLREFVRESLADSVGKAAAKTGATAIDDALVDAVARNMANRAVALAKSRYGASTALGSVTRSAWQATRAHVASAILDAGTFGDEAAVVRMQAPNSSLASLGHALAYLGVEAPIRGVEQYAVLGATVKGPSAILLGAPEARERLTGPGADAEKRAAYDSAGVFGRMGMFVREALDAGPVRTSRLQLAMSGLYSGNRELVDSPWAEVVSHGQDLLEYISENSGRGFGMLFRSAGLRVGLSRQVGKAYLGEVGTVLDPNKTRDAANIVGSWIRRSVGSPEQYAKATAADRAAATRLYLKSLGYDVPKNEAAAFANTMAGGAAPNASVFSSLEVRQAVSAKDFMSRAFSYARSHAETELKYRTWASFTVTDLMARKGWGPEQLSNLFKSFGYDGILEEMMEERYVDFAKSLFGWDDLPQHDIVGNLRRAFINSVPRKRDQSGQYLTNWDQLVAEFIGFAIPFATRQAGMIAMRNIANTSDLQEARAFARSIGYLSRGLTMHEVTGAEYHNAHMAAMESLEAQRAEVAGRFDARVEAMKRNGVPESSQEIVAIRREAEAAERDFRNRIALQKEYDSKVRRANGITVSPDAAMTEAEAEALARKVFVFAPVSTGIAKGSKESKQLPAFTSPEELEHAVAVQEALLAKAPDIGRILYESREGGWAGDHDTKRRCAKAAGILTAIVTGDIALAQVDPAQWASVDQGMPANLAICLRNAYASSLQNARTVLSSRRSISDVSPVSDEDAAAYVASDGGYADAAKDIVRSFLLLKGIRMFTQSEISGRVLDHLASKHGYSVQSGKYENPGTGESLSEQEFRTKYAAEYTKLCSDVAVTAMRNVGERVVNAKMQDKIVQVLLAPADDPLVDRAAVNIASELSGFGGMRNLTSLSYGVDVEDQLRENGIRLDPGAVSRVNDSIDAFLALNPSGEKGSRTDWWTGVDDADIEVLAKSLGWNIPLGSDAELGARKRSIASLARMVHEASEGDSVRYYSGEVTLSSGETLWGEKPVKTIRARRREDGKWYVTLSGGHIDQGTSKVVGSVRTTGMSEDELTSFLVSNKFDPVPLEKSVVLTTDTVFETSDPALMLVKLGLAPRHYAETATVKSGKVVSEDKVHPRFRVQSHRGLTPEQREQRILVDTETELFKSRMYKTGGDNLASYNWDNLDMDDPATEPKLLARMQECQRVHENVDGADGWNTTLHALLRSSGVSMPGSGLAGLVSGQRNSYQFRVDEYSARHRTANVYVSIGDGMKDPSSALAYHMLSNAIVGHRDIANPGARYNSVIVEFANDVNRVVQDHLSDPKVDKAAKDHLAAFQTKYLGLMKVEHPSVGFLAMAAEGLVLGGVDRAYARGQSNAARSEYIALKQIENDVKKLPSYFKFFGYIDLVLGGNGFEHVATQYRMSAKKADVSRPAVKTGVERMLSLLNFGDDSLSRVGLDSVRPNGMDEKTFVTRVNDFLLSSRERPKTRWTADTAGVDPGSTTGIVIQEFVNAGVIGPATTDEEVLTVVSRFLDSLSTGARRSSDPAFRPVATALDRVNQLRDNYVNNQRQLEESMRQAKELSAGRDADRAKLATVEAEKGALETAQQTIIGTLRNLKDSYDKYCSHVEAHGEKAESLRKVSDYIAGVLGNVVRAAKKAGESAEKLQTELNKLSDIVLDVIPDADPATPAAREVEDMDEEADGDVDDDSFDSFTLDPGSEGFSAVTASVDIGLDGTPVVKFEEYSEDTSSFRGVEHAGQVAGTMVAAAARAVIGATDGTLSLDTLVYHVRRLFRNSLSERDVRWIAGEAFATDSESAIDMFGADDDVDTEGSGSSNVQYGEINSEMYEDGVLKAFLSLATAAFPEVQSNVQSFADRAREEIAVFTRLAAERGVDVPFLRLLRDVLSPHEVNSYVDADGAEVPVADSKERDALFMRNVMDLSDSIDEILSRFYTSVGTRDANDIVSHRLAFLASFLRGLTPAARIRFMTLLGQSTPAGTVEIAATSDSSPLHTSDDVASVAESLGFDIPEATTVPAGSLVLAPQLFNHASLSSSIAYNSFSHLLRMGKSDIVGMVNELKGYDWTGLAADFSVTKLTDVLGKYLGREAPLLCVLRSDSLYELLDRAAANNASNTITRSVVDSIKNGIMPTVTINGQILRGFTDSRQLRFFESLTAALGARTAVAGSVVGLPELVQTVVDVMTTFASDPEFANPDEDHRANALARIVNAAFSYGLSTTSILGQHEKTASITPAWSRILAAYAASQPRTVTRANVLKDRNKSYASKVSVSMPGLPQQLQGMIDAPWFDSDGKENLLSFSSMAYSVWRESTSYVPKIPDANVADREAARTRYVERKRHADQAARDVALLTGWAVDSLGLSTDDPWTDFQAKYRGWKDVAAKWVESARVAADAMVAAAKARADAAETSGSKDAATLRNRATAMEIELAPRLVASAESAASNPDYVMFRYAQTANFAKAERHHGAARLERVRAWRSDDVVERVADPTSKRDKDGLRRPLPGNESTVNRDMLSPGSRKTRDMSFSSLAKTGKYKNIVVFDTETTGTDQTTDDIIEFSAVRVPVGGSAVVDKSTFARVSSFVSLKAGDSLDNHAEAVKTNKITAELMKTGDGSTSAQKSASKVLAELVELIKDGDVLFTTHNVNFDSGFLLRLVDRAEAETKAPVMFDANTTLREFLLSSDWLDTVTVVKDRVPAYVNGRYNMVASDDGKTNGPGSLAVAAREYGVQWSGDAHRALTDVYALIDVMAGMEGERHDLDRYVNVIGFNPAFGAPVSSLPGVTHVPQLGYRADDSTSIRSDDAVASPDLAAVHPTTVVPMSVIDSGVDAARAEYDSIPAVGHSEADVEAAYREHFLSDVLPRCRQTMTWPDAAHTQICVKNVDKDRYDTELVDACWNHFYYKFAQATADSDRIRAARALSKERRAGREVARELARAARTAAPSPAVYVPVYHGEHSSGFILSLPTSALKNRIPADQMYSPKGFRSLADMVAKALSLDKLGTDAKRSSASSCEFAHHALRGVEVVDGRHVWGENRFHVDLNLNIPFKHNDAFKGSEYGYGYGYDVQRMTSSDPNTGTQKLHILGSTGRYVVMNKGLIVSTTDKNGHSVYGAGAELWNYVVKFAKGTEKRSTHTVLDGDAIKVGPLVNKTSGVNRNGKTVTLLEHVYDSLAKYAKEHGDFDHLSAAELDRALGQNGADTFEWVDTSDPDNVVREQVRIGDILGTHTDELGGMSRGIAVQVNRIADGKYDFSYVDNDATSARVANVSHRARSSASKSMARNNAVDALTYADGVLRADPTNQSAADTMIALSTWGVVATTLGTDISQVDLELSAGEGMVRDLIDGGADPASEMVRNQIAYNVFKRMRKNLNPSFNKISSPLVSCGAKYDGGEVYDHNTDEFLRYFNRGSRVFDATERSSRFGAVRTFGSARINCQDPGFRYTWALSASDDEVATAREKVERLLGVAPGGLSKGASGSMSYGSGVAADVAMMVDIIVNNDKVSAQLDRDGNRGSSETDDAKEFRANLLAAREEFCRLFVDHHGFAVSELTRRTKAGKDRHVYEFVSLADLVRPDGSFDGGSFDTVAGATSLFNGNTPGAETHDRKFLLFGTAFGLPRTPSYNGSKWLQVVRASIPCTEIENPDGTYSVGSDSMVSPDAQTNYILGCDHDGDKSDCYMLSASTRAVPPVYSRYELDQMIPPEFRATHKDGMDRIDRFCADVSARREYISGLKSLGVVEDDSEHPRSGAVVLTRGARETFSNTFVAGLIDMARGIPVTVDGKDAASTGGYNFMFADTDYAKPTQPTPVTGDNWRKLKAASAKLFDFLSKSRIADPTTGALVGMSAVQADRARGSSVALSGAFHFARLAGSVHPRIGRLSPLDWIKFIGMIDGIANATFDDIKEQICYRLGWTPGMINTLYADILLGSAELAASTGNVDQNGVAGVPLTEEEMLDVLVKYTESVSRKGSRLYMLLSSNPDESQVVLNEDHFSRADLWVAPIADPATGTEDNAATMASVHRVIRTIVFGGAEQKAASRIKFLRRFGINESPDRTRYSVGFTINDDGDVPVNPSIARETINAITGAAGGRASSDVETILRALANGAMDQGGSSTVAGAVFYFYNKIRDAGGTAQGDLLEEAFQYGSNLIQQSVIGQMKETAAAFNYLKANPGDGALSGRASERLVRFTGDMASMEENPSDAARAASMEAMYRLGVANAIAYTLPVDTRASRMARAAALRDDAAVKFAEIVAANPASTPAARELASKLLLAAPAQNHQLELEGNFQTAGYLYPALLSMPEVAGTDLLSTGKCQDPWAVMQAMADGVINADVNVIDDYASDPEKADPENDRAFGFHRAVVSMFSSMYSLFSTAAGNHRYSGIGNFRVNGGYGTTVFAGGPMARGRTIVPAYRERNPVAVSRDVDALRNLLSIDFTKEARRSGLSERLTSGGQNEAKSFCLSKKNVEAFYREVFGSELKDFRADYSESTDRNGEYVPWNRRSDIETLRRDLVTTWHVIDSLETNVPGTKGPVVLTPNAVIEQFMVLYGVATSRVSTSDPASGSFMSSIPGAVARLTKAQATIDGNDFLHRYTDGVRVIDLVCASNLGFPKPATAGRNGVVRAEQYDSGLMGQQLAAASELSADARRNNRRASLAVARQALFGSPSGPGFVRQDDMHVVNVLDPAGLLRSGYNFVRESINHVDPPAGPEGDGSVKGINQVGGSMAPSAATPDSVAALARYLGTLTSSWADVTVDGGTVMVRGRLSGAIPGLFAAALGRRAGTSANATEFVIKFRTAAEQSDAVRELDLSSMNVLTSFSAAFNEHLRRHTPQLASASDDVLLSGDNHLQWLTPVERRMLFSRYLAGKASPAGAVTAAVSSTRAKPTWSIDSKGIAVLTGDVFLADSEDLDTATHEYFHSMVSAFRTVGGFSERDIKGLRKEFGAAPRGSDMLFNEEAAARRFVEFVKYMRGGRHDYTSTHKFSGKVKQIFVRLWEFIKNIRAIFTSCCRYDAYGDTPYGTAVSSLPGSAAASVFFGVILDGYVASTESRSRELGAVTCDTVSMSDLFDREYDKVSRTLDATGPGSTQSERSPRTLFTDNRLPTAKKPGANRDLEEAADAVSAKLMTALRAGTVDNYRVLALVKLLAGLRSKRYSKTFAAHAVQEIEADDLFGIEIPDDVFDEFDRLDPVEMFKSIDAGVAAAISEIKPPESNPGTIGTNYSRVAAIRDLVMNDDPLRESIELAGRAHDNWHSRLSANMALRERADSAKRKFTHLRDLFRSTEHSVKAGIRTAFDVIGADPSKVNAAAESSFNLMMSLLEGHYSTRNGKTTYRGGLLRELISEHKSLRRPVNLADGASVIGSKKNLVSVYDVAGLLLSMDSSDPITAVAGLATELRNAAATSPAGTSTFRTAVKLLAQTEKLLAISGRMSADNAAAWTATVNEICRDVYTGIKRGSFNNDSLAFDDFVDDGSDTDNPLAALNRSMYALNDADRADTRQHLLRRFTDVLFSLAARMKFVSDLGYGVDDGPSRGKYFTVDVDPVDMPTLCSELGIGLGTLSGTDPLLSSWCSPEFIAANLDDWYASTLPKTVGTLQLRDLFMKNSGEHKGASIALTQRVNFVDMIWGLDLRPGEKLLELQASGTTHEMTELGGFIGRTSGDTTFGFDRRGDARTGVRLERTDLRNVQLMHNAAYVKYLGGKYIIIGSHDLSCDRASMLKRKPVTTASGEQEFDFVPLTEDDLSFEAVAQAVERTMIDTTGMSIYERDELVKMSSRFVLELYNLDHGQWHGDVMYGSMNYREKLVKAIVEASNRYYELLHRPKIDKGTGLAVDYTDAELNDECLRLLESRGVAVTAAMDDDAVIDNGDGTTRKGASTCTLAFSVSEVEDMWEKSETRRKLESAGREDPRLAAKYGVSRVLSTDGVIAMLAPAWEDMRASVRNAPWLTSGDAKYLNNFETPLQLFVGQGMFAYAANRTYRDKAAAARNRLTRNAAEFSRILSSIDTKGDRPVSELSNAQLSMLSDLFGLQESGSRLRESIVAGEYAPGSAKSVATGLTIDPSVHMYSDVAKIIYDRSFEIQSAVLAGREPPSTRAKESDVTRMIHEYERVAGRGSRLVAGANLTPEQAYRTMGVRPANVTLGHAMHNAATQLHEAMFFRSTLINMMFTPNDNGNPIMFVNPRSTAADLSGIPDEVWAELAKWWSSIDEFKDASTRYDPTQSGVANARRIYEKISALHAHDGTLFRGDRKRKYRTMDQSDMDVDSIEQILVCTQEDDNPDVSAVNKWGTSKGMLAADGSEAYGYLRHLFQTGRIMSRHAAMQGLQHVMSWSKSMSVAFSWFFQVATKWESPTAALGFPATLLSNMCADPSSGTLEAFKDLQTRTGFGKEGWIDENFLSQKRIIEMMDTDDPFLGDLMVWAETVGVTLNSRTVNPMETDRAYVEKWVDSVAASVTDGSKAGDRAAAGVRNTLRTILLRSGEKAFTYSMNATKLAAAAQIALKLKHEAVKEGRAFDPVRDMRGFAEYVDSEIGGMNPLRYAWAHPEMRKGLGMLMFSHDWTRTAWEAAGGNILEDIMFGGHSSTPAQRDVTLGRWIRMAMFTQLGLPAFFQVLFKLFGLACGVNDDRDKWLPWMNASEKGRTSANFRPLAEAIRRFDLALTRKLADYYHGNTVFPGRDRRDRKIAPSSGMLERLRNSKGAGVGGWKWLVREAARLIPYSSDTDHREMYFGFGKQFNEVLRWNPVEAVGQGWSKTSRPLQAMGNILVGANLSDLDIPIEWIPQVPGSDEGSIDGSGHAGERMLGMLGYFLQNVFTPFSRSGAGQHPEAGILAYVGNVKKGRSATALEKETVKRVYAWAINDRAYYPLGIRGAGQRNLNLGYLDAVLKDIHAEAVQNGMSENMFAGFKSRALNEVKSKLIGSLCRALPKSGDAEYSERDIRFYDRCLARVSVASKDIKESVWFRLASSMYPDAFPAKFITKYGKPSKHMPKGYARDVLLERNPVLLYRIDNILLNANLFPNRKIPEFKYDDVEFVGQRPEWSRATVLDITSGDEEE